MDATTKKAIAAITVACVIWLGLQISAAMRLTPTHDEYWHLPIGVSIWKTGRFDQDPINPPLVRILASAPAAPFVADPTPESPSGERDYGDAFIAASEADARSLYASGRIVIAVTMLAGVLILTRIAWQAAGWPAATVAFLLAITDPNLFAHGGLVTHDGPAAVAFLAVLWSILGYHRTRTTRAALIVGAAVGVAMLTKFTALVWLPVLVGLVTVECLASRFTNIKRLSGHAVAAALMTLLIVNSAYLFQGSMRPFGSYLASAPHLTEAIGSVPWLGSVIIPFPEQYVVGIDRVRAVVGSLHPVYLEGQHSPIGFDDYYLKCWLYKTPHIVQLLSIVGTLVLVAKARTWPCARAILLVAIPTIALVVIPASLGTNQLGYRYLLPVYPFTILFAACGCASWISTREQDLRRLLFGFGCFVCVLSLRFHPNNLTYFNELAGGPRVGPQILIDSNIDWGQSLHQLKAATDEDDLPLDGLAYFGSYPPSHLGFDVPAPPSFKPQTGRYAVSVNFVQGRAHTIREQNTSRRLSMGELIYFSVLDPDDVIGNSIAVFDLSEADIADFEANYGSYVNEALEQSLFMTDE